MTTKKTTRKSSCKKRKRSPAKRCTPKRKTGKKTKSRKKKRKVKSSTKKCMTAYNIYIKENFHKYKGKNPEVMKCLAADWKKLSASGKEKYRNKVTNTKRKRTAKKPYKLTAYAKFVKEKCKEKKYKDLAPNERIRKIAAEWKASK